MLIRISKGVCQHNDSTVPSYSVSHPCHHKRSSLDLVEPYPRASLHPLQCNLPPPARRDPSPSAPIKMCLFRIEPSRAPIDPPGAAPVLMTLEEDQMLTIAAENEARVKAITDAIDAREKPEPARPVSLESLRERRESLANGTRRVG